MYLVCLYPCSSIGRSLPLNDSSLPRLLLISQTRTRHFLNTFSHLLSLFSCISNFSSNMFTWSSPWQRHEPTYKRFEPQSLPPHLLCRYSSAVYFFSSSESPYFILNCIKLIQCICRFAILFYCFCVLYLCHSFLFCSQ